MPSLWTGLERDQQAISQCFSDALIEQGGGGGNILEISEMPTVKERKNGGKSTVTSAADLPI